MSATNMLGRVLCQVCHLPGSRLCQACSRSLRPAPDRLLPGGLRLVSAFEHDGPAKALIHGLKYRGVLGYERLVARVVGPRLPRLPIVPIPRSLTRRLTYGVDGAAVISEAIAAEMEVPVLGLLRPHIHSIRRAGGDHRRPVGAFAVKMRPSMPVILVDDVVTTGATLVAAAVSLGQEMVSLAVAANVVPVVSSLRDPDPRLQWPQC